MTIFIKWAQKFSKCFSVEVMLTKKPSDLIAKKQLSWVRSALYHALNKENHKKSGFTFSNTLIRANSLILKNAARSFTMLNNMMENKNINLTNISIIFLERDQNNEKN